MSPPYLRRGEEKKKVLASVSPGEGKKMKDPGALVRFFGEVITKKGDYPLTLSRKGGKKGGGNSHAI